jgi:hypothetical protein
MSHMIKCNRIADAKVRNETASRSRRFCNLYSDRLTLQYLVTCPNVPGRVACWLAQAADAIAVVPDGCDASGNALNSELGCIAAFPSGAETR